MQCIAGDLTPPVAPQFLQGLVQYWQEEFSWKQQQAWLNSHFHNFRLKVRCARAGPAAL